MESLIKLSFLILNPEDGSTVKYFKRVSEAVAAKIPLVAHGSQFIEGKKKEFAVTQPTTIEALKLYWNFYKANKIIDPRVVGLEDKIEFLKLATYLNEPLSEDGLPLEMLFTPTTVKPTTIHHYGNVKGPGLCDVRFNVSESKTVVLHNVESKMIMLSDLFFLLMRDDKNFSPAHFRLADTDGNLLTCDYEKTSVAEIGLYRFALVELSYDRSAADFLYGGPMFYEECVVDGWTKKILSHFNQFNEQIQVSIASAYWSFCFVDGKYSEFERWTCFYEHWPEMAKFLWETQSRAMFYDHLGTKKHGKLKTSKTLADFMEYLTVRQPKVIAEVGFRDQRYREVAKRGGFSTVVDGKCYSINFRKR